MSLLSPALARARSIAAPTALGLLRSSSVPALCSSLISVGFSSLLFSSFPRSLASSSRVFSSSFSTSSSAADSSSTPASSSSVPHSILSLALSKVPELGFSLSAVESAVTELGLSRGALGLFPNPALSLVQFYHEEADKALHRHVTEQGDRFLSLSSLDRLRYLIQYRLSLQLPFISRWTEALAVLAAPNAAPESVPRLARLADDLAFLSGDLSTNVDWYSKRALIAGVYVSTELFLITDKSPHYNSTWQFLERRLADAAALSRVPGEVHAGLSAIAGAAFSTFGSMFKSGIQHAAAGAQQFYSQAQSQSPSSPQSDDPVQSPSDSGVSSGSDSPRP